jgi:hypothetical protein
LPGSLEAVVEKALAKDPAERYKSAGELMSAFAHALTKDVITKLDEGSAKKEMSFASQLTERIDEASLPGETQIPTIAMSEKTMAEIGVNAKIPKESAVKHKTKKPAQKEKQYQKPTPHISKEIEKPTQPSFIHQLKSKPLLLVLIGLIVVAILAFALKGTSGGLSCSSVEECVDRMGQLQAQGDLDGALAAMDKATSMVPRERHTDYAWIWCERAILLEQLDKINQSDESREICAAWGRGE